MMLRMLPAVALLLAVAGCGGSGSAGSPGDAVRAYNSAVADGDGARACGRLDTAAQDELRNSVQGAIRASCRQVIETLAAFYDDATKQKLREAKVASRARNDTATATFSSPVGLPGGHATYQLRRDGGDWKITSLGIVEGGP